MASNDLSHVNPLVSYAGPLDGFISSRLMAAYAPDDEHTIHVSRDRLDGDGRITWHYVLERNGEVIFEGTDFGTPAGTSYGEAARGILGFLTLCEGDVEAEYFADYTRAQLEWRDEYAADLSMFGMPDDEN